MRAALALAAVIATLTTAATTARAAPTTVSWPVFISVKAAKNTTNDVRMSYEFVKGRTADEGGWDHFVFDTAGVKTRVTEPPSCYPYSRLFPGDPLGSKVVFCPDGTSIGEFPPGLGEDFRVFLGDHADRFTAGESIGSFEVHGGTGNDRIVGNDRPVLNADMDTNEICGYWTEDELAGDSGNDTLYGRRGPDLLEGGSGKDRLYAGRAARAKDAPGTGFCPGFGGLQSDALRGGSGNDVLHADNHQRDQTIDCGTGRDTAYVDKGDPKTRRCEKVKRG